MDFLRLLTIGKRHWVLLLLGVLVGAVAMVAVLYRYDASAQGPARFKPRSYTTYSVDMQMIVEDAGFWVGRGTPDPNQPPPDGFDKTVTLAQTYASLMVSDAVRRGADASAGPLQGELVSQNVQQSPIIAVTLTGKEPLTLSRYGLALAASMQSYLKSQQDLHGIPARERITVRLLSSPGKPKAEASRTWEMALIALLTPLAAALGLALLRDGGRGIT